MAGAPSQFRARLDCSRMKLGGASSGTITTSNLRRSTIATMKSALPIGTNLSATATAIVRNGPETAPFMPSIWTGHIRWLGGTAMRRITLCDHQAGGMRHWKMAGMSALMVISLSPLVASSEAGPIEIFPAAWYLVQCPWARAQSPTSWTTPFFAVSGKMASCCLTTPFSSISIEIKDQTSVHTTPPFPAPLHARLAAPQPAPTVAPGFPIEESNATRQNPPPHSVKR